MYFIELGGADALVFTAGVGENDPEFRQSVVEKIGPALGIKLNYESNKKRGEEILISTPDSKIKVYVIPTNEELVIARDTVKLLKI
jgi:acetate kinase